jgi:hypothetical protein
VFDIKLKSIIPYFETHVIASSGGWNYGAFKSCAILSTYFFEAASIFQ